MAVSKKHSLVSLLELRVNLEDRPKTTTKPFQINNRLTSLFPVDSRHFPNINSAWAFQCLCGEYCVQDSGAVKRGSNKSCGCLRKVSGRGKNILTMYKNLISQGKYTLIKIGSSASSRDWGFRCKTCGIESFKLSHHEVLHDARLFCRCSQRYVCSSEEAKKDLLEGISETTWSLHKWDEKSFTTKNVFYPEVKCKVCADIKPMLYGNILKKGCYSCGNIATSKRLKKDTSWFIEEANKVHGDKYDYSKVNYTSAKTHVDIICHEHEEPFVFSQSPDNHKNKGKGCPECKRLNLRHVHFHLSRVEANKDTYKKIPSGVYLLKLEEGKYKVGISCNVYKRSQEIDRSSPFQDKCETVVYNKMNLYKSIYLENSIHKLYSKYNIHFDKVWEGHSECFTLTTKQVNEIKTYIERGYI